MDIINCVHSLGISNINITNIIFFMLALKNYKLYRPLYHKYLFYFIFVNVIYFCWRYSLIEFKIGPFDSKPF